MHQSSRCVTRTRPEPWANERMQNQSTRKVGVRLGRTHDLLADSVRNGCFAIQRDLDKNAMVLKGRGWVHAVYRFSEFGCRGGGLRERGGTTERGYAGRWARPPDEQSLWYDGRIYSKACRVWHTTILQPCCHVLLGYALHLRILRIERGVSAACALATVCAAAVIAHSTSDDGFAQRLYDQARQAGQYPPPNPAEAQKRAGSSSRALARHSVVPAAILVAVVYETPTLAHPAAAPIVTVSASRMGALGGSQGILLGPCMLDCYSRSLVSLARS